MTNLPYIVIWTILVEVNLYYSYYKLTSSHFFVFNIIRLNLTIICVFIGNLRIFCLNAREITILHRGVWPKDYDIT